MWSSHVPERYFQRLKFNLPFLWGHRWNLSLIQRMSHFWGSGMSISSRQEDRVFSAQQHSGVLVEVVELETSQMCANVDHSIQTHEYGKSISMGENIDIFDSIPLPSVPSNRELPQASPDRSINSLLTNIDPSQVSLINY